MRRLLRFIFRTVAFTIFLMALALSGYTFRYLNFDFSFGFLLLKQEAIRTGWYLPAYYAHIFMGAIILVIGFFQITPSLNLRWRKLHRILGRLYVGGILLFAAPGGFIMSLFINRGGWVLSSFVVQGILWFYFTWMAYRRIQARDITGHKAFMYRSFAITLAAVFLRIYIFIASYHVDLGNATAYATLAWLSWVPQWIAVEVWLRIKLSDPTLSLSAFRK